MGSLGDHLENLWELFDQGSAGDEWAMRLHDVAMRIFVRVYETRSADVPALCLLCDHAFTMFEDPPAAVVILAGKVEAPERAIGNALCDRCFDGGGPELMHSASLPATATP